MAGPEPRNTGIVYRRVRNSRLHVSVLGLGGWLTFGGHVESEQIYACIKQAYDCGINFFDTAENYSGGQYGVMMGKAIKKFRWKRNDVVISTNLNYGGANGEILVNNHGISRTYVIEGLTVSLERLNLNYVDIVYAHRPGRLTPMEETVRSFNYVIEQEMAFYRGTSEWSADEIAEACGIAKDLRMIAPIMEQPFYNILERKKVEGEFQRLYKRYGIGLTTFSPLKFGLLSRKYNGALNGPPPGSRFDESKDKSADSTRENYGNDDWKADIAKVAKLKLSLAWCLKNPNISAVITGASKPEQIMENVKCLEILDMLTPDIMDEIDRLVGTRSN